MMKDGIPAPLDETQREVLMKILTAPPRDCADLAAQIPLAKIAKRWGEKSQSFDVEVPDDAPPSRLGNGIAPAIGDVLDAEGQYVGEILLWVTDGKLSAVEFAWIGGTAPTRFPEANEVAPARR